MPRSLFLTEAELDALRKQHFVPLSLWKSPLGLPSENDFKCTNSSDDSNCSLYIYPSETATPSQETEETLMHMLRLTLYLSTRSYPLSLVVDRFRVVERNLLKPVLILSCKRHPSLAEYVHTTGLNNQQLKMLANVVMKHIFYLALRGIFHKNIRADNTFIEVVGPGKGFKVAFSGFLKASTFIYSEKKQPAHEMRKEVAIFLAACMTKLLGDHMAGSPKNFLEILDPSWKRFPIRVDFVQENNAFLQSCLLNDSDLFDEVKENLHAEPPLSKPDSDYIFFMNDKNPPKWVTPSELKTTTLPEDLDASLNQAIAKELALRGLTTQKS